MEALWSVEADGQGTFDSDKLTKTDIKISAKESATMQTRRGDDLIKRLLTDAMHEDGKVTKDELPERMHSLTDEGDWNGDDTLDCDTN